MRRSIFFAIFLASAATAQNGIPVSGIVYDATTGKPLPGIHIRFANFLDNFDQLPAAPFGAVSREDGTFSNTAVTPGDYLIVPMHAKYCFDLFTPREPKTQTVLLVRSGKPVDPIRVPLVPCGTISGRLMDDHGQPVQNSYVQSIPLAGEGIVSTMHLQLMLPNEGRMRAEGEFLLRLPPGKYHLQANAPFQQFVRLDRPSEGPLSNTWYPSALDAKSATPVEVVSSGALRNIEITLRRRASLSISGTVSTSDPKSTFVELTGDRVYRSQILGQNSAFTFVRLEPGQYKVRARTLGSTDIPSYSGQSRVTLRDRSEENVSLSIGPALTLSGRIQPLPGNFPAGKLLLSNVDFSFQEAQTCKIDAEGRFECTGLAPSNYSVLMSKELAAWFAKDLKLNGVSIKGREVDLSSGSAAYSLQFALGAAGTIQGRVLPRPGRPFSLETRILVVPDGATRFPSDPDGPPKLAPDGTYTLSGIVPGKYRLLAVDPLLIARGFDESAIPALIAKGELIEITEGQTLVKDVQPVAGETPNVP